MQWLDMQGQIPTDYFRVLSALVSRASADIPLGLSANELSRLSGMSVLNVENALDWLKKHPEGKPLIGMRKQKEHYRLSFDEFYFGQGYILAYTKDYTDHKRLAVLEQEFTAKHRNKYPDRSGLSQQLQAPDNAIAEEVEYTLGRALTITEAYFLGKLLAWYGGDGGRRFLQVFRQQRDAAAPLRNTWVILRNGKLGKGFEPAPHKPVIYKEL